MNIGNSIKIIRKKRKISQSKLAIMTGITQAALSGIESGKRPNETNLKNICTALQVPESLVYLMGIGKDDALYNNIAPIVHFYLTTVLIN
jgi:XRE family transcriptional regulator, regulator of sulfur utilization